jgi:hypothetical protein
MTRISSMNDVIRAWSMSVFAMAQTVVVARSTDGVEGAPP